MPPGLFGPLTVLTTQSSKKLLTVASDMQFIVDLGETRLLASGVLHLPPENYSTSEWFCNITSAGHLMTYKPSKAPNITLGMK
jgi:hypothetical protein